MTAADRLTSPERRLPMQILDVLRRLSDGAVLECQARTYFLRGERVPARIARNLIRLGLVEPPPDLFAPLGGRLTAEGFDELQKLEHNHVVV